MAGEPRSPASDAWAEAIAETAAAEAGEAAEAIAETAEEAEAAAEAAAETEAEEAAPPRARAKRRRPERVEDAGGLTEEDVIAAGTRHRHIRGIAAGAALVAACVLGALLVSRLGRPGAVRAPRATTAPADAPAPSGTAPFDASSLAARPKPSAQAGGPKGAATTRKRRRIVRIADRKLFDLLGRKDDVPMEAPSDDVELDSAKDVLDTAAVERTVAASRRAFDACVTKALRLNPALRVSKRATLIVTVEPDGRVTGAWIAEEQIEGTDLGRCLVDASSRMSFPTFEGEAIDVSIPLSLSAVQ